MGTSFLARHMAARPVILRDNDISRLHHVRKREIHAIASFGDGDCFCSGFLKHMRGIAKDHALYLSLSSDFYGHINDGAAVGVD